MQPSPKTAVHETAANSKQKIELKKEGVLSIGGIQEQKMKCNIKGKTKSHNTDDPRLREIVENLESLKIGVDEPFRFHCTMCGKCCTNREDILLTPKDLFYISKELKKTPEDVVKEFCETYIGSASRFPIVRLYPTGYDKHCPLLNGNKCSVHAVKPVVCAMFPIGRVLQGSADGPKPEEITSDSVQYIFVKPGCGDDSETHTVREWFGEFGIPMEDEFFVNWQRTLNAVSSAIRRFEKGFSPETMNAIWNVVFGLTYLNYDTDQDFAEQFSDNAAKIMKLISMAEGRKSES